MRGKRERVGGGREGEKKGESWEKRMDGKEKAKREENGVLKVFLICLGVGKPVLVIPWIVLQELDNHKMHSNGRLSGKARKAVRLLFSCFSNHHPRVRSQTMEEVIC